MSRVAVYRNDRELRSYRRKIRRQREIRRNILLSIAAVVILLTFLLSFYSITSLAKSDAEDISYKYFTSIQVQKGDTLWSIAEDYIDVEHYDSPKEYITEVMFMNNLSDDSIVTGQYLIIPYYSYDFVQ